MNILTEATITGIEKVFPFVGQEIPQQTPEALRTLITERGVRAFIPQNKFRELSQIHSRTITFWDYPQRHDGDEYPGGFRAFALIGYYDNDPVGDPRPNTVREITEFDTRAGTARYHSWPEAKPVPVDLVIIVNASPGDRFNDVTPPPMRYG